MQCRYCREEIIDGALLCRYCGKKQSLPAGAKRARTGKIVTIAGTLLIVAIVGFVLLEVNAGHEDQLREERAAACNGSISWYTIEDQVKKVASESDISMDRARDILIKAACPTMNR